MHDGRPHVVSASRVDEVRDRVVHRRLPRGRHVNHDDIRALARLQRPDLGRHAERARSTHGRHREGGPSSDHPRVAALQLVQERRHPHRLEHVEIVVAGGAVRAEPDGHSSGEIGRDGSRAAG